MLTIFMERATLKLTLICASGTQRCWYLLRYLPRMTTRLHELYFAPLWPARTFLVILTREDLTPPAKFGSGKFTLSFFP